MPVGWRGVIEEYRPFLPVDDGTPVVTLLEGGTPLLPAPRLSERVGAHVFLKFEGLNPTGSFKDRGMTMAISKAVEEGAKAVVCASTGNTSASAAAYAVRAGLTAAVRSFGFSLLDSGGDALLPGEHWMLWKGDALSLLERDELAAWVGDHVRTFANPAYRPPEPVVRVRRLDDAAS